MAAGKIGLALGGGAARGWAHIGVLQVLEEAGIRPEIVVGTSIGAVCGGTYVAGALDKLEEFAREMTRSKMFSLLDFNLAGSGLITGNRLTARLEENLSGVDIETLERRFVAVATELGTGHEVWLTRGRLVDAMRASYALPGIFHPVRINDRWFMDGALVNPIPVSVCRALGAQLVIAVNLHADTFGKGSIIPDYGTETEADALDEPINEVEPGSWPAAQLLYRQFFGKGSGAPGISTVMMDAFSIIQDRVARARMVGDPPDLMVKPKLDGFGLFDFHRAEDLILHGRNAAQREMETIETAIQSIR